MLQTDNNWATHCFIS